MKSVDESIMAYVDGELDDTQRALLETTIASDAGFARQVDEQRRLRSAVMVAFDPILGEPIPSRLIDALKPARRSAQAPRWFALAASVAAGVGIGLILWRSGPDPLFATVGGHTVAGGRLARALEEDLTGSPRAGNVASVGGSFLSVQGKYCRIFAVEQGQPSRGLACRSGERWIVEFVAESPAGVGVTQGYRHAATPMPPELIEAIESRMDGDLLDAQAEAAARDRHWNTE
jgi:hypothetical protein